MIPLGTPCYLRRCAGGYAPLNGRVIEVVGHVADRNGIAWQVCAAPWVRETFGGRELVVHESNLRPIQPPGIASSDARMRIHA